MQYRRILRGIVGAVLVVSAARAAATIKLTQEMIAMYARSEYRRRQRRE